MHTWHKMGRTFVCEAFHRSGALAYVRALKRYEPKILIYHSVSPPDSVYYKWSLGTITPSAFDKQIKYLKKYYRIISLKRLISELQQSHISKKTVVLTFDDGFSDNYSFAWPILRKYNVPATIFITTNVIGSGKVLWKNRFEYLKNRIGARRVTEMIKAWWPALFATASGGCQHSIIYKIDNNIHMSEIELFLKDAYKQSRISDHTDGFFLNWEQVCEMADGGIEFGNHTCSHPIMSLLSRQEQRHEIVMARDKILNHIPGNGQLAFSYPFGLDQHFTDTTIDLVKETGHYCGVTGYYSPIAKGAPLGNLYAIGRISIPPEEKIGSFACRIESLSPGKVARKIIK